MSESSDRLRECAERLVAARGSLVEGVPAHVKPQEAEGGCGVLGLACSVPIAGRHLLRPMRQMCNRGNGKGGGIAAVGLSAAQLGVDEKTLAESYLVQVAYLDPSARAEAERDFLEPAYEIGQAAEAPSVGNYRAIAGLEVAPPTVWRYFARPRPAVLEEFAARHGLEDLAPDEIADEFVFQASYRINRAFYASLGDKRAFVLSHGKDTIVMKLVGYAEQAIEYYRLQDLQARVWIGHQRYPTKGRVWHPGGAHPFIGLHEALVHNGDFANYASICEYLAQRNLAPLFLTDTEVAVLLFDLWSRVYRYPLEYVIEAMAPTTERDFDLLPPEKKRTYRRLQLAHVHGSPDGPWFFIVARNDVRARCWQLLGITDTSMLRPQVFALHEGHVQIGLIASERQAIDALLEEVSAADDRVNPVADLYWNARGGSHTDGGAFVFSVSERNGKTTLECTNKFGAVVRATSKQPGEIGAPPRANAALAALAERTAAGGGDAEWLALATRATREWDYGELEGFCKAVEAGPGGETAERRLTLLLDRPYDCGKLRRSRVDHRLERSLVSLFSRPGIAGRVLAGWSQRDAMRQPPGGQQVLYVDVSAFSADGEQSAARFLVEAAGQGWRRFVVFGCRGHRFLGCGLGAETKGIRLDVYGRSGDYLASGLDGAEMHVHGAGQDQLGQILKSGHLVVHGDVGQAFMYGAKGGEVFVRGNAAGRPLINAVGNPHVVINGTCLDYLAESFMAGDPLQGGGFVVLNGIRFAESGQMQELETPYPGSNLFSLASGGALYVRDPRHLVSHDQLNGGRFARLTERDWALIEPLLASNERHFGVSKDALLAVGSEVRPPQDIYRKIEPIRLRALEGA